MKNINSANRIAFIKTNSKLFWHIPEDKKTEISDELLIEFISNYGNHKSIKELFELFDINYVAKIFYKGASQNRTNYFPQVINYFSLYFKKYCVDL